MTSRTILSRGCWMPIALSFSRSRLRLSEASDRSRCCSSRALLIVSLPRSRCSSTIGALTGARTTLAPPPRLMPPRAPPLVRLVYRARTRRGASFVSLPASAATAPRSTALTGGTCRTRNLDSSAGRLRAEQTRVSKLVGGRGRCGGRASSNAGAHRRNADGHRSDADERYRRRRPREGLARQAAEPCRTGASAAGRGARLLRARWRAAGLERDQLSPQAAERQRLPAARACSARCASSIRLLLAGFRQSARTRIALLGTQEIVLAGVASGLRPAAGAARALWPRPWALAAGAGARPRPRGHHQAPSACASCASRPRPTSSGHG